MELVYITHSNILDLHAIAPVWSWALVIGAGYGLVRLAVDIAHLVGRVGGPAYGGRPKDPPTRPGQPAK